MVQKLSGRLISLSLVLSLFVILQIGPAGFVQATSYQIALEVQFDSGQAIVKDKYKSELKELVSLMDKGFYGKRFKKLFIEGHADAQEKDPIPLSKRRGEAVKESLFQMGADSSRLEVKGYGNARPIASDKTPEGRTQNRRVDFDFELDM